MVYSKPAYSCSVKCTDYFIAERAVWVMVFVQEFLPYTYKTVHVVKMVWPKCYSLFLSG